MKVIVPANESTLKGGICVSFGRAPYFLVLDTQSDVIKCVENPGAASSGGAGIKAAQAVVDENVEAILVPRIGKNASEVLDAAQIRIYRSVSGNILENLEAYKSHKLEILKDIHPGFHNHGGRR